ncbi:hypothetical protein SDRG_00516 [Saprolegnia diclina VS20]|uniref:Serine aminopeptidase S33 domain-containing protein n=1 Tax=Saprolegnia diclina (strain VS20) TaxID=1156394 RepID=T0R8J3_SAPDV|nr:hypothetical protein SDRG_00516 [Saprolegnia diclina VS20]EQC42795.1 hypothetical protein SDRG_00516 [Saprolegnia diclina VS20]|eukprot:XP_008604218.1 hypothetical protein SDRG_00516 [Saprolegnia diclina VS20]
MFGLEALASVDVGPSFAVGLVVALTSMALLLRKWLYQARPLTTVAGDRIVSLANDRLMHTIVVPAVAPTNTLVLIVPGNPGVPGFYEPMMRHLHALGHGSFEVVGLSHTGHSMPWLHRDGTFDLSTQIADKIAYIDARLKANPLLELVLVGHSIGAHIALGMFSHCPHRVSKVVLLQPAVMHIAQSASGQRLGPFFRLFYPISLLVWPFEWLPSSLVKAALPFFVGQNTVLQSAAHSLLNHHVIRNILNMARHEMAELKDIDHELMGAYQDKVRLVFSEVDNWVPTAHATHLTQTYPEVVATTVDLPHAFMTDARGSNAMAEVIYRWMHGSK